MTDPEQPTYAEHLAAEQSQREADRAKRRAAIGYNANAVNRSTDEDRGDAA